jgi:hypothetical protein
MGEWVGPRVGLDGVEERKILTLPRFELFDISVVQSIASLYTDGAIAASSFCQAVTLKRSEEM